MSRLEELIAELCPNGVEYKALGEIASSIYRGSGITRDQIRDQGIPCVRYGEIYTTYDIWFDKCVSFIDESLILNKKYFGYGDVLFAITGENVEDIAKSCVYVGKERCLAGGDIVVMKHSQNPKYLSYALSTKSAQAQKSKGKVKSKVVHSSVPSIQKIKIPVPPLPVQEEIVRILDNFAELAAELAAELNKRKQQYQYYKDYLFTNNYDVEYIPLRDWALNQDAKRRPIAKGKRESGNYPYYGASGIVDYVKDYIFNGDYLLVSEDGANLLARNTPIAFSIAGKTWVNNHAHILQFPNITLQKYVEFYLNNIDLTKYISAAAQPKLTQENLNNILIPKPSFESIKYIVSILDRFDTLCNDLTSGLPAEIEARKKQYEYYRDKLLTFKEAV